MGNLAIKTHSYNKKLLTKKTDQVITTHERIKTTFVVCYISLRYLSLQVQLSNQRL